MHLLEKAGLAEGLDEGCFQLAAGTVAETFIAECGKLRHWPREAVLWPV